MFDYKYFFSLLPSKTVMLDYGCGRVPIWNVRLPKKIKKIYLYDKVKISVKSNSRKITILKKILLNFAFKNNSGRSEVGRGCTKLNKFYKNYTNVILFNSVLQYFHSSQFKVFTFFLKNKNVKLIILSDIPLYNRYVEFLISLFLYPDRLLYALKYRSKFKYLKYRFYLRSEKKILNLINYNYNLEKYFIIKRLKKNLYGSNFTRYTLLLERK